jgi:hypothetical protein
MPQAPVTRSRTSTASPTAQIFGSLVCSRSFTLIPPRAPRSRPALFASAVSGRTPTKHDGVRGNAPPAFEDYDGGAGGLAGQWRFEGGHGIAEVEGDTLGLSSAWSQAAISGSSGAMTCGIASITVSPSPCRCICSAISSPM